MKRAICLCVFTIILLLLLWMSSQGARDAAWATGASGIIGSIMIAIPFFKEDGLKWTLTVLCRGNAGDPATRAALEESVRKAEAKLAAWSPTNRALIVGGLLYLALSYVLGVITFELTP